MLGQNWKTTIFGLVAILLGVAGPVLTHYVPVVGLDWSTLCTTLATFAVGGGLLTAKDSTTHSIPAQVQAADAAAKAVTPEQAEKAKAQMKQADVLAANKP
jgi:hypothetical protein